jgi:DNA primase
MRTPDPGSTGRMVSTAASLRTGQDWAACLQAAHQARSRGGPGTGGTPDLEAAWTVLEHLAQRAGFAVRRADCAEGEGFTTWRNRLIRISPQVKQAKAVTALAHQLGHVLLHSRIAHLEPSKTVPCRGIRKVEADSVAFLVSLHLGIEPGASTFPSVASWAGTDPRARPEATARTIAEQVLGTAARITARLDEMLPLSALKREALTATASTPRTSHPGQSGPVSQEVPAQASLLANVTPIPTDELVRVHQDAARFFQKRLAGSWVPGYLTARGLDPGILARWQVGYAPYGWSGLVRYLREIGYCDELIEAAGLARRSARGTSAQFFADRAMFPIRSADGTVVAFIGRAYKDAPARVPKYLNSPTTCIYDKSAVLFGLWEARDALAQGAHPVIVEGPLDAMAITGSGDGRYAGVAPCGTSLTARHVAALANATDLAAAGVLVAFDNDAAGRRAAVRAYYLLAPITTRVEAVVLPAGRDPAQVLADHGPAVLAATLAEHTRPLADLVIDAELEKWSRWLDYAEGQINAMRAAAPLIAAMPPDHVGHQIARLAERLDLDYATVTCAVTDALPAVIAASADGRYLRGPPARADRPAQQDFPTSVQRSLADRAASAAHPASRALGAQAPSPVPRVPH